MITTTYTHRGVFSAITKNYLLKIEQCFAEFYYVLTSLTEVLYSINLFMIITLYFVTHYWINYSTAN